MSPEPRGREKPLLSQLPTGQGRFIDYRTCIGAECPLEKIKTEEGGRKEGEDGKREIERKEGREKKKKKEKKRRKEGEGRGKKGRDGKGGEERRGKRERERTEQ